MKIILIGNYLPDKQESMIRFTHLLDNGFRTAGVQSEIWTPPVLLGSKVKVANTGIGKWLGYIDKYLIFPIILKWRLRNKELHNANIRFHICDHSNSPYLKYLPPTRSSITCHDVIAIRTGLGFSDTHEQASKTGRVLQKWILHHLTMARSVVFVSRLSLNQFKELSSSSSKKTENFRVIHNSFNADFRPMGKKSAKDIVLQMGIDVETPFLLHIGSNSRRKNRKLLVDMAKALTNYQTVNICFAGETLDGELLNYAELLGLRSRVIQVVNPDHLTLVALYNLCSAFVFPSFSEGFGWPLIEAQACGAPVVASNIEPMPEVSGGAALHFDPTRAEDFANGYILLQNNQVLRQELIQRGFKNGLRFGKEQMVKAYLTFLN